MKPVPAAALVLLLAFASKTPAAQVFRCADAGGVTFQETPCPANARERSWEMASFPPVNSLERERLLQREALLDARLIKRAEIEAAERIARDALKTRELEAERERAQAAAAVEPAYVIPFVIRPYRAWRPRPGPQIPRY